MIRLLTFILAFSQLAEATPCSIHSTAKETCSVVVSLLRPTQFALGFREIEDRTQKLANLSSKKLTKYIDENPAPVVIGPNGEFYITDHQHLAMSLLRIGVTEMNAEIQDNLSQLSPKNFWTLMQTRGWVYLYDQNGIGPLSYEQLPARIDKMQDDPYRGLAWAVRKQGGYDKTDVLYGDFKWANFFRTRVKAGTSDQEFDQAVSEGVVLAHTPAAKGLPGYTP